MSETEQDGTELVHEENPWRDKQTLESLYDEGLTYKEIADQLGTGPSTVSVWLKRHEITIEFPEIDLSQYEEPYYSDAELLERLYHDEQMSTVDIAAFLETSSATIGKWLDDLGIKKRSLSRSMSIAKMGEDTVSYYTYDRGHSVVKSNSDRVVVHRLIAVAEWGLDAVLDKHVHHKNGVPWDNRPENLELLSNSKHQQAHLKVDGLDRVRVAEFYENGEISSRGLGDMFDISSATALYIHDEFYGGEAA